MSLQPIADFFAHFSWSELVSAVLAAGIVAAVNIVSNHKLAKKRDKLNREGNEEIQRKAEIRQYRTAEDDRRDQDQQREQKERLQAVKSYYVAYTEAINFNDSFTVQADLLTNATRIFRLEAIALDHEMGKQALKILKIMELMLKYYRDQNIPDTKSVHRMLIHMVKLQEPMFAKLMNWGLSGKARKFGELMDQEIAGVQSW